MPWNERSVVERREELVTRNLEHDEPLAKLAHEFEVSWQTAYKWIARYRIEGTSALADRSRRPHASPRQTDEAMRQQVLALAEQHPTWGGRKLHILVDTAGLLLKVLVHPANVADQDGARLLLADLRDRFPRLAKLWVGDAY